MTVPEPIYDHDWHGDRPFVSCRKCWQLHPDYWIENNSHPGRAYHEPTHSRCAVPDTRNPSGLRKAVTT